MELMPNDGVHLRLGKCKFHTTKTKYLGFIISTEGISMDPRKLVEIRNWDRPTTVKEVQEFLGFTNFYRRFILGYLDIVKPLTKLTGKHPWEWTSDQQDSFDRLKKAFASAPVLLRFDSDKPITLETDASDIAYGGVLSQHDDSGHLQPVD